MWMNKGIDIKRALPKEMDSAHFLEIMIHLLFDHYLCTLIKAIHFCT